MIVRIDRGNSPNNKLSRGLRTELANTSKEIQTAINVLISEIPKWKPVEVRMTPSALKACATTAILPNAKTTGRVFLSFIKLIPWKMKPIKYNRTANRPKISVTCTGKVGKMVICVGRTRSAITSGSFAYR